MRRWVLAISLLLIVALTPWSTCRAQDDPEYRMEIGGGLGLMAYQGDFNGNLMKGMQPMAAIVAKYKMNPRMAWSAQIATGKVKGSSKDVKTWYPEIHDQPIDFSTSLTDFSLRFEYNFWPFGTGKEYLGARRLTPFMAMGAGLAFFDHVAFQVPIGLGVKYKLKDRLNLTAEWMMHFSGSDKLDGIKDPYDIKSSGLFKNTDCYTTLQVALTYDIWAKCKTCNNDR